AGEHACSIRWQSSGDRRSRRDDRGARRPRGGGRALRRSRRAARRLGRPVPDLVQLRPAPQGSARGGVDRPAHGEMSDAATRLSTALADRYRVERELGAGGMATVYLAHDLKHDRDVAIKVLHPDLGAALGSERFLSEIRTTARLQHPHILPLLDSGEADGLLYYVMPLVSGETLRARLERERLLPIQDAVRVAREVGDALGYAHGL